MKDPEREKLLVQLSPYVDGELSVDERKKIEQHLSTHAASAGQVADFRAVGALTRHALDMQADNVDWKGFTDGVMGRLTPEKLPFTERLRLSLSETFKYQRRPFIAAALAATVAVAIAVPLGFQLGGGDLTGYGASRLEVQNVSVDDDAPFKPVVMETSNGDAVVWIVGADEKRDAGKKKKKKKDAEENEEELTIDPDVKAGEL